MDNIDWTQGEKSAASVLSPLLHLLRYPRRDPKTSQKERESERASTERRSKQMVLIFKVWLQHTSDIPASFNDHFKTGVVLNDHLLMKRLFSLRTLFEHCSNCFFEPNQSKMSNLRREERKPGENHCYVKELQETLTEPTKQSHLLLCYTCFSSGFKPKYQ